MNKNKTVTLPNGYEIQYGQLGDDLANDNIVINEPEQALVDNVSKYYSSFLQRNIMANRHDGVESLDKYYNTKLADILEPSFLESMLPELVDSTRVLLDVMKENGKILLLSDYDLDGVGSAAIGQKFFSNVFKYDNFEVIINKRNDGNGINDNLTEEVLQYKDIALVMTSDHGSANRVNLTRIRDGLNCKVIVTDPGIIYFTLLHAYKQFNKDIPIETTNYIYYMLTYVGLTIISDCMDLRNYVNRKIVIKALVDINSSKIKHEPFWEYIKTHLNTSYIIDETILGFNVIPILNATGRIADPRLSYEVLVSKSLEDSKSFLNSAIEINDKRKKKTSDARHNPKNKEFTDGIIKVILADNSNGVQGIISSGVMYDDNLKLVIVFTKVTEKGKTYYSGSGRSQDENLNIKLLLDDIAKKSDIIVSHGGHPKAIGAKILPDIELFYKLLQEEVSTHELEGIANHYVDDYIYSVKHLILSLFDIVDIGPYGIGFEKPSFCSDFYIDSYRIFKKSANYLSVNIKFNPESETVFSAFYTIKEKEFEEFENNIKNNKFIRMVYTMGINSFRNHNKIMLNSTYITFK